MKVRYHFQIAEHDNPSHEDSTHKIGAKMCGRLNGNLASRKKNNAEKLDIASIGFLAKF